MSFARVKDLGPPGVDVTLLGQCVADDVGSSLGLAGVVAEFSKQVQGEQVVGACVVELLEPGAGQPEALGSMVTSRGQLFVAWTVAGKQAQLLCASCDADHPRPTPARMVGSDLVGVPILSQQMRLKWVIVGTSFTFTVDAYYGHQERSV